MSRRDSLAAGPPTPNLDPTPNLSPAEPLFDHEKLDVYQAAIAFCSWAGDLIATLPRIAARDQLDRASTSIPLNIAEGNAKFSSADRAVFLRSPEAQQSSVHRVSMCWSHAERQKRALFVRRKSSSRRSRECWWACSSASQRAPMSCARKRVHTQSSTITSRSTSNG